MHTGLSDIVLPLAGNFYLVPPKNLERHHQRIPEEIRVNSGVENVDAAVVARRSHEGVVPVELRRPYRLMSFFARRHNKIYSAQQIVAKRG